MCLHRENFICKNKRCYFCFGQKLKNASIKQPFQISLINHQCCSVYVRSQLLAAAAKWNAMKYTVNYMYIWTNVSACTDLKHNKSDNINAVAVDAIQPFDRDTISFTTDVYYDRTETKTTATKLYLLACHRILYMWTNRIRIVIWIKMLRRKKKSVTIRSRRCEMRTTDIELMRLSHENWAHI